MMRATLVRALVLSAVAFAGALTPVTCLGEDGSQLPTKATKELSPELLSLFQQKHMVKNSPILVRIFKEEVGTRSLEAGHHRPFPDPQDLSDLSVVGRSGAEVT